LPKFLTEQRQGSALPKAAAQCRARELSREGGDRGSRQQSGRNEIGMSCDWHRGLIYENRLSTQSGNN